MRVIKLNRNWLVLAALCLSGLVAPAALAEGGWTFIGEDDGIRLFERAIPGQELPGFRGVMVVSAPVDSLVAELKDHTEHTQWMHRCVEARQVEDLGNGRSIDYNRTDAPWPVWDRDVVLEARWTTSGDGKRVMLHFENADPSRWPLPRKTVRMPRLKGHYEFRVLGNGRTRVTYQVEADPGGSLPTWLAKRVARELPHNTLTALRTRVSKSR